MFARLLLITLVVNLSGTSSLSGMDDQKESELVPILKLSAEKSKRSSVAQTNAATNCTQTSSNSYTQSSSSGSSGDNHRYTSLRAVASSVARTGVNTTVNNQYDYGSFGASPSAGSGREGMRYAQRPSTVLMANSSSQRRLFQYGSADCISKIAQEVECNSLEEYKTRIDKAIRTHEVYELALLIYHSPWLEQLTYMQISDLLRRIDTFVLALHGNPPEMRPTEEYTPSGCCNFKDTIIPFCFLVACFCYGGQLFGSVWWPNLCGNLSPYGYMAGNCAGVTAGATGLKASFDFRSDEILQESRINSKNRFIETSNLEERTDQDMQILTLRQITLFLKQLLMHRKDYVNQLDDIHRKNHEADAEE